MTKTFIVSMEKGTPMSNLTREEAIKRIKEFGLYHAIGDLPNSAKTVEAFNMAIEALRHDTIFEQIKWERDAALQTLEEHGIGLKQIADRPQGEWEEVPYKRVEHEEVIVDETSWRCTNCGDARKRNEPDMRFCPNCGADMRGEEE